MTVDKVPINAVLVQVNHYFISQGIRLDSEEMPSEHPPQATTGHRVQGSLTCPECTLNFKMYKYALRLSAGLAHFSVIGEGTAFSTSECRISVYNYCIHRTRGIQGCLSTIPLEL